MPVNPIVPVGTPRAEGEQLSTQYLRQAEQTLTAALAAFKRGYDSLNARALAKFREIDQTAGEGLQGLQRKYDGLKAEIDEITGVVKELETSGAFDPGKLKTLGAKIKDIGSRFKTYKNDLQDLANSIDVDADKGARDHIVNLERYATELLRDYQELDADFKRLAGRATGMTRMGAPAEPEVAHTKHYGEFNLTEHLERARKKQGDNKTWF